MCASLPIYTIFIWRQQNRKTTFAELTVFCFCSLLCSLVARPTFPPTDCLRVHGKGPGRGCCLVSVIERGDGWQDVCQSQLSLMRCRVTRAPESCQMTRRASLWPETYPECCSAPAGCGSGARHREHSVCTVAHRSVFLAE